MNELDKNVSAFSRYEQGATASLQNFTHDFSVRNFSFHRDLGIEDLGTRRVTSRRVTSLSGREGP